MKCNNQSSNNGFTLVELLVTMGLSSIVMTAIASMTLYTARSFATMTNYVDLDNASRTALDIITRDVRQVSNLECYSTNTLVFADSDNELLTFYYNPDCKTLTRIKGNDYKVLLRECDELEFSIFQRNNTNASFQLIPTVDPYQCKAINVSWTCSRKILGAKVNTESVQTARVVVRKQKPYRYY